MEYLTPRQLQKLAPGTARRPNAKKEKLLCTVDFLDGIKAQYRPVFAMQGTTHRDSGGDARDGRHLVVASRDDGIALALLNSHCKLLRVWIGMGLWNGEDLLLAPQFCLPVQRWKGVNRQFEQFTNEDAVPTLHESARELQDATANTERMEAMSRHVAKAGYIKGRGRPNPTALANEHAVLTSSALNFSFALVKAARLGNLAPHIKADHRNVKGVRRPDAYWHLAKAAYVGALKAGAA